MLVEVGGGVGGGGGGVGGGVGVGVGGGVREMQWRFKDMCRES